ncbi:MAG: tRNA (N6-isopentenyl adenosine(37)-C2)-methylthiotransferase MiaB [Dethiobacter sp.]|jgi:tRNA-2-methylthio-N6-dimethylallyladenosine synthase|nr:MAG: tRNA (N6-isopentenyl adenosine(37)-C2)-methylthiotransferase MiaB [Dethiobacter sp.]
MENFKINTKKYHISTYGCQMNVYDSEVLSGYLENMGFMPTEKEEDADVLIINTCAVRKKAEEKVFSLLGKLRPLKKKNPGILIVLWGCMVQQESIAQKVKERYGFVDLVAGTHSLGRFPDLLEKARVSPRTVLDLEIGEEREHLPIKRGHQIKAWVPISHGCNNFCSYCIVPYVRGPEKSRPPQNIINEVRELVNDGYREITLLGQNVNSYGKDLEQEISFADLLNTLDRLEGRFHIRYMTSHPRDFSEKLIRTIQQSQKICEHFHLPLQSGSNKVLKLMNRGYTREYYLELVAKIRDLVQNSAVTTDIITGFPGEEEKDFEETLDMLEKVRFDAAYTFVYSPRKGTKATEMEGQVTSDIKKKRIIILNELQSRISMEVNQQLLGTEQVVLVEGRSKTDPNVYTGRTRTNKIVHFSTSEKNLLGMLVNVDITEAKSWTLTGNYKNIS